MKIFNILLLSFITYFGFCQTTIFTNPGKSYTNIDNTQPSFPVVDLYGPIDITNCTSVRFSMDFNFSLHWYPLPAPRMETPEVCTSAGGCSGIVPDALNGGCFSCWDFMLVEVSLDGVTVYSELIGGVGENRQSGTLNWTGCTNGASSLSIKITNMNWAGDETNTFSNLRVECWNGKATASANSPVCEGNPLTLTGMLAMPTSVLSHIWTTNGGGTIVSPTSLITNVNNPTNGQTFTLTTTDANSCTSSAQVTVTVNPAQNASFNFNNFCAGSTNGPSGIVTPGGTFSFNPTPSDGATINPATGNISGATGGSSYSVQYTTPGPCPGTEIRTVTANPGPVGTLSGSAVLCPGQCATFSFSFSSGSEPYTVNLTANPPGFALPPIPGITASSSFMICYNGSGFLPSFDPGTLTVTIPTIFSGTGSLTLTGISDASGCPGSASGSFNLTLSAAPTAQPAGPLQACADANGQGLFNLTSLDGTIRGGNGSLTVNWFEDMAGTIPITNPSAFLSGSTTVYASVSNGACSSALVPVILNVTTSSVPFVDMFCAQSGTSACTICITNGQATLSFLFGDNNSYTVTVRNLINGIDYTGTVSNAAGLTVPVSGTGIFQLISAQPLTGCPNFATYTNQVTVQIVNAPQLDPLVLPPACQSATLPLITGSNLSGNQAYYSGPNGTGVMYIPGNLIYSSQTLYIFDSNGGCQDEKTLQIIIHPLVTFDEIMDLSGCTSVVLPPITGTGVSSSAVYNTNSNGTGTTFTPGSTVTQSILLYVMDPNADQNCINNTVDINVTIHPLPQVPAYSVNCSGGNGNGLISVSLPLGAEYEYQLDNGTFQASLQFNGVSNGAHTIRVKNIQTGCENVVSLQVNCDCGLISEITLPAPTGSTCSGLPFTLLDISFSGVINDITISTNGSGTINPTLVTSSPFNLTYQPGIADEGKVVSINLVANDPDGAGPCSGESRTFFLTVHPNPNGSVSGLNTVCTGSNLTLTASGGNSYQWSDNGGNTNVATFNNILVRDTIFVTITDANGCRDTVQHIIDVGSITAGRDTITGFCRTLPAVVNLNNYLTTGATSGGIWKNGSDTIVNVVNFAITDLPLGFTTLIYMLDDPLCGRDTAVLRVNIRDSNNAGLDNMLTYCEGTTTNLDLVSALGVHDSGGIWQIATSGLNVNLSDPSAVTISNVPPGNYSIRYLLPENGCAPDTAVISLNINAFTSAGNDVVTSSCVGATLDLFSIISTSDRTGRFLNPSNFSGLNANIWNTAGQAAGSYTFYYEIQNIAPCLPDTAKITVNLQNALFPGNDQISGFCEGTILDLKKYLDVQADPGGTFYYQNQIVPNGIFTPSGSTVDFVFTYEVGDDILCPKRRSIITLRKELKPVFQIGMIDDICDGKCITMANTHNASVGSAFYFSSTNISGTFKAVEKIDLVVSAAVINLPICTRSGVITTFYRPPVGDTITIRLDSLISSSGCTFSYGDKVMFKTLPLATKTISPLICKGSTYTLGGEVFSENRPTGTVVVSNLTNSGCDTIVSVSLTFRPDATGSFQSTYCDQTKTVTIGSEIFSVNRPSGTAILSGASVFGCDSIVQVNLKYEKSISAGNFSLSTCDDRYEFALGGQTFSKSNPSGTVLLSGAAAGGCDSIVNVTLTYTVFNIAQQLNYKCNGEDAEVIFNLASDPGPYQVSIDGVIVGTPAIMPYRTVIKPGNHTLQVSTVQGCTKTFQITVDDSKGPDVTLTQSPLPDGAVQINTLAPPNVIYGLQWTPVSTLSCNNCPDPIANPSETTTYTLQYKYNNDCTDSRQIIVERINTEIILPNIFSPGNDGFNDYFYVQLPDNINGTVKSMAVYDRWGNLMFFTENKPANMPSAGWDGFFDGRIVQPGVYVFLIEVQIESKAGTDKLAGSITVVK